MTSVGQTAPRDSMVVTAVKDRSLGCQISNMPGTDRMMVDPRTTESGQGKAVVSGVVQPLGVTQTEPETMLPVMSQ